MLIKKEHIEQHFIINRDWKALFISKFPNWTNETWERDVLSIFEANGYRYDIQIIQILNCILLLNVLIYMVQ
jgi:hypothetical protein